MAQSENMALTEPTTLWYIGQHESNRQSPATSELLGKAQELGYDMMTTPITTMTFQSRVVAQLEEYIEHVSNMASSDSAPGPLLSPLTPKDTDLSPKESNSALIALTSSWIDLGSEDPLIADVSRQVFNLEVAYATFCGVQNLIVTGPLPGSNEMQYARTLLEALGSGPYLQLHILLPMVGELEPENGEGTHLAELVREQYASLTLDDEVPETMPENTNDDSEKVDLSVKAIDPFGAWDTWNGIRTMCDYTSRLCVGKQVLPPKFSFHALLSLHIFHPSRLDF
jgi:protein arginine N-methyltransferase 5